MPQRWLQLPCPHLTCLSLHIQLILLAVKKSIKPRLHEQFLCDNFYLTILICSCRPGKSTNFYVANKTCHIRLKWLKQTNQDIKCGKYVWKCHIFGGQLCSPAFVLGISAVQSHYWHTKPWTADKICSVPSTLPDIFVTKKLSHN